MKNWCGWCTLNLHCCSSHPESSLTYVASKWRCAAQMHCHPSQDRRPHRSALALLQLQLAFYLFAFHLARASLFISPSALSSCLWGLISSLPLVRKGREDQIHASHLPTPFLGNIYLISFLFSPFILFLQSFRDWYADDSAILMSWKM